MAKKEFGEYYLGLDIGTDSVGWAVTDLQYQIMKFHGKAMWGSRLFPEAQTAADRRAHRIARRRLQRRGQRLGLLQDIFMDEITKVDPQFFARLQDSMLHEEDKSVDGKNSLFNGPGIDDKAYHKKYPTIYHLRSELIDSNEEHDIRLVYLALHHILKYRGHFLFDGDLNAIQDLDAVMKEFSDQVKDSLGFEFVCEDAEKFKEILKNRDLGRQSKQKEIEKLFDLKSMEKEQSAKVKEMVKAMVGLKFKVDNIFDNTGEEVKEFNENQFGTDAYEENKSKLEVALGEDYYILEKLQAIRDWAVLASILRGEKYLSHAMVKTYKEHEDDLMLLKKVIKKYFPEKYDDVFKNVAGDKLANYCAYIGYSKIKRQKVQTKKKCSQEDFQKYIAGLLKDVEAEDSDLQRIKARITSGEFMPKIRVKDNGSIPNQVHVMELDQILKNASSYLPFLNQTDEDGITPIDKIHQILTFRIPYYVGPLNNRNPHAQNCWVVRKFQEKIYPWNFDEIVDREASAEKFINRMLSKCTYLPDQFVLPKNSILYSRFMVLNELNNLKIKGEEIPVELKQGIFNDLFMTRNKVSLKAIIDYINAKGLEATKEDITGIDTLTGFKSNMRPAIEMRKVLGNEYNEADAEDMIQLITLFGADRKMLKEILKKRFSQLSDDMILQVSKKSFNGWGNLSRKFLIEIRDNIPDPATGEYRNIIDTMWNENKNLMQLLGRDYHFAESVQAYKRSIDSEDGSLTYQMVKDLYVSPAVKRSIWQAIGIVKEIRGITGHDPKKIFIEMARGPEQEKKRTTSRKDKLLALYQSIQDESRDWIDEISKRDESDFRGDKLYLYYMQQGKCMYTGETIDLEDLFRKDASGNELYDIDHIFPRSKIKDDSIDNRVLVKSIVNREKTNEYPIKEDIQKKMKAYWGYLKAKDLISSKKYERLMRNKPLSMDELSDFVARQLVETRQSTKAVAEILGDVLYESEIVYVKAGLVSEFRHEYDMLKCREVNDLHHAKDAYLNIVVGNVYNTKFTKDPRNFFKEPNHEYSLNAMFRWNVRRGDTVAWIVQIRRGYKQSLMQH